VCLSSTEEGLEKPDPVIFDLALSRAGCLPEEAIMVGDRLDNDIGPAKSLGWKTIRVLQGFASVQEPRSDMEKAHHVVNSLSEIPPLLDNVLFKTNTH
jgi:FMN phosphatase YigB (HAD superfamily)